MATQMLQRRGTTAEWSAINPVLGDGELGWNRDTGEIKVGDGVTAWMDLECQFVLKSVADAVGDILVGTGPNEVGRLPIGLPGQRLTVAGDGTLQWATSPNPHAVIDAAGDLIVGSADDTPARLAKGAIGERLSVKADGTVGWEPLPAAGNPFTVIDAAGDLLVGTGPDAVGRLAKGTSGQALTVDGAGNLVWATPNDSTKVAKAGDAMTGQLRMRSAQPIRLSPGAADVGSDPMLYGSANQFYIRQASGGYCNFDAGAIYDTGNRVYSASNPPPASGMTLKQIIRSEVVYSPQYATSMTVTIPTVVMAKTELRNLGTTGNPNTTYEHSSRIKLASTTTVVCVVSSNSGGTITTSFELTEYN